MCKVSKKGIYTFYQPKEIRKITFFEIVFVVIAIYSISLLFRNTNLIGINLLISVLFSIIYFSKYIAPVLMKKYNATIDSDYLVIDNVDVKSIKIKLRTITKVEIAENNSIKINGSINKTEYEYDIVLDECDLQLFVNIINEKVSEYRNMIRNEINRSVKK